MQATGILTGWVALAVGLAVLGGCDLNGAAPVPEGSPDVADVQAAADDGAAAAVAGTDGSAQGGSAPVAQVQFSPGLLDFGAVQFGHCEVKTAALSNWGAAAVAIQGLDLTALGPQFKVEWLSPAALAGQTGQGGAPWLLAAPLVLQPFHSAGLSVRFCPTKAGPVAAQLPLVSSAGPLALGIQATGVAAAVPCVQITPLNAPKSLDFGDVVVGKAAEFKFTVKNCGSVDLAITLVQLTQALGGGAGEFSVSWQAVVDGSLQGPWPVSAVKPVTIAKQGSVDFGVSYSPVDATPAGQKDTAKLTLGFSHGEQFSLDFSGSGMVPQCPVAVALLPMGPQVVPQTKAPLNGGASYSPIGAAIKNYLWTINQQPAGSNQALTPQDTFPNPFLQVNAAGEYAICLDVWDEFGTKSCKPACVQVLVIPSMDLHVELLWNTPADSDQTDSGPAAGADLDLHFAHPMAAGLDVDCDGKGDPWFSNPWDLFWFNPKPSWGDSNLAADDPSLDLDDTDGAGPENLNLEAPEGSKEAPFEYSIGVHYWNDHSYGPSVATVAVYVYGTLALQASAKLQPLDMWYVGKLSWPYGESGKAFEACRQSGYSCVAGKNLMWQAKGDPCITPCYEDQAFTASISGAAAFKCTPGLP